MARDGLALDNLICRRPTADGRVLHASCEENDDLFWPQGRKRQFRGRRFLEYRVRPVGPTVFGGLVAHRTRRPRRSCGLSRADLSASDDYGLRRADPRPRRRVAVRKARRDRGLPCRPSQTPSASSPRSWRSIAGPLLRRPGCRTRRSIDARRDIHTARSTTGSRASWTN